MSLPERQRSSGHHDDLWQVSEAAGHLAGQACTVSARHIRDGTLRLQFNRDVAYYAQGIVRDVEAGRKSVDEGLEAIEAAHDRLTRQVIRNITKKRWCHRRGVTAGGWRRHLLCVIWDTLRSFRSATDASWRQQPL